MPSPICTSHPLLVDPLAWQLQGLEAYSVGSGHQDNPYREGTAAHACWDKGWQYASDHATDAWSDPE